MVTNRALINSCSTVQDAQHSVYRDTLPQTGLTISNCNISGLVNAIGLVGAPTDTVMIQGNILASGEIIVRTDGATNVTIQSNSFQPGANYDTWWWPLQTTSSTYIENNQFSPVITDNAGTIALGSMYMPDTTGGAVVPVSSYWITHLFHERS